MKRNVSVLTLLCLLGCAGFAADAKKPNLIPIISDAPKPKPEFQYKSDGIEVPAATADEPRVKAFGPETVSAAKKYLDDGAHHWVREKTCIACHSTGVYMVERSALTPWLGTPSEEVWRDFIDEVPKEGGKADASPIKSVWRSSGLASWDKHVVGKLSDHTDRSLRHTLTLLGEDGAFHTIKQVEIPYITTHFELTVQAARAITTAPGWLANLKDADLLARIERMKKFLREHEAVNDYELAMKLRLASLMPDLVPQDVRDTATAMLWRQQQPDGGWSTRRMSDLMKWHETMDPKVVEMIKGEPDAANPASDPYMTAFAIVLLRESAVPHGRRAHSKGRRVAEDEPARDRSLVDEVALPRHVSLHHLHQHRAGAPRARAVRRTGKMKDASFTRRQWLGTTAATAGSFLLPRLRAATSGIAETEHFQYRLAPDGPYVDSQRDHKAFGFGSGKIFLSEDNAKTWPHSAEVAEADNITWSCLLKNGNVLFATRERLFRSTDNLKTHREIIVKNRDGSDYLPHKPLNPELPGWYFHSLDGEHVWDVNGTEMLVWGNYCNVIGGAVPVNIYSSTDGGQTVKIAYSFGQNPKFQQKGAAPDASMLGDAANQVIARHVHNVTYSPTENAFTGCAAPTTRRVMRGVGKSSSA